MVPPEVKGALLADPGFGRTELARLCQELAFTMERWWGCGTEVTFDALGESGYVEGMGRRARVVVPGMPHRITQRGNRRRRVVFKEGATRPTWNRWPSGAANTGWRFGAIA